MIQLDSVRVWSISFRQLKGVCVCECVCLRESEQKDKHAVNRTHVLIQWADKSLRDPKRVLASVLFLFEREHCTNTGRRCKICKTAWFAALQRKDLECKSDSEDKSLGINFFHWLLLYLWVTIREEPSGAGMIVCAFLEVGGDDEWHRTLLCVQTEQIRLEIKAGDDF